MSDEAEMDDLPDLGDGSDDGAIDIADLPGDDGEDEDLMFSADDAEGGDDVDFDLSDMDGDLGGGDDFAAGGGEVAVAAPRDDSPEAKLKRSIFSVPIEVTVTVGTARPLIGDLLRMGRDHLLPLDSNIDDPVELRVKDRVIARGELTQTDDDDGRLGIRLTEIVELNDLLQ